MYQSFIKGTGPKRHWILFSLALEFSCVILYLSDSNSRTRICVQFESYCLSLASSAFCTVWWYVCGNFHNFLVICHGSLVTLCHYFPLHNVTSQRHVKEQAVSSLFRKRPLFSVIQCYYGYELALLSSSWTESHCLAIDCCNSCVDDQNTSNVHSSCNSYTSYTMSYYIRAVIDLIPAVTGYVVQIIFAFLCKVSRRNKDNILLETFTINMVRVVKLLPCVIFINSFQNVVNSFLKKNNTRQISNTKEYKYDWRFGPNPSSWAIASKSHQNSDMLLINYFLSCTLSIYRKDLLINISTSFYVFLQIY